MIPSSALYRKKDRSKPKSISEQSLMQVHQVYKMFFLLFLSCRLPKGGLHQTGVYKEEQGTSLKIHKECTTSLLRAQLL